MEKQKALKWLEGGIVAMMLVVAGVIYLFDPFFQYHEPYFGLKKVFYNRDYQMVGSIRNLSYDSVLVGSSVAENFNSDYLDEQFDCSSLKIIRASGSAADLLHYLELAHEKQEIKQVFWCMDIFALTSSGEVTIVSDENLKYLHTETMLDDATYLFNKDVLFKEIPHYIASSVMDVNTGGKAYDWSDGKEFSAQQAMKIYNNPAEVLAPQACEVELEFLKQNLENILLEINSHPETEYIILFPPYSMLWWDCGYKNGLGELYFKVLENTLPALADCENVKLYYFQADRDIVCNLDNYMDMIHYRPEINRYMLESVTAGSHQVSGEDVEECLQTMRSTYEYIIDEGIYEYYPK